MSETFIHATAEVSPNAEIGAGAKIWQHCAVLAGARIGAGALLSQNVYVESGAVVGERTKIKNNVCLYSGVVLEEGVFVGPCAVFTNVRTPRAQWSRKDAFLPTRVCRGATIGANATIVCGVTVGPYALIGAGSVVTRDVPAHCLVYGNPARPRGWVCVCGEILPDKETGEHACPRCASRWKLGGGAPEAAWLAEPVREEGV